MISLERFYHTFWQLNQPDVEADSRNFQERGQPHESKHDHTIAKTHEHVENSSDCDKFVKTKVERCKEEEMGKSISPDIVSCAQSPISSSSSMNSTGRVRMVCGVYRNSSSAASSICSRSDLDPIDERKRTKLLGKKRQKKKNELIEDLRICKTPCAKNPEGIHQERNVNEGKFKSIQEEALKSDESDSSSSSVSSTICSQSKMDRIIKRNSHKSLDGKSRKKQNELMEYLRISKNRYCDNSECVDQKTQKCEEVRNSITGETSNGVQSTIPTTTSINSEGRIRMSCMLNSTCTSESSNNYRISELDPIDERNRHKLGKKSRKEQNELMDVLRISKTRCSVNPESVQQKTDKNIEKSNVISGETASDIQPPIPSNSSGNSEGMAIMEDRTFTSETLNTCSSSELVPELENCAGGKRMLCHEDTPLDSSSTDKSSETAHMINREKHKLCTQEYRRQEKELMKELRLLIPGVLNNPKASKAEILLFATNYIDTFKQNLQTRQKMIEVSRNEIESLKQEIKNLKQTHNIPES